ncbi:hypothetical protein CYMTET_41478 [Cymbomonas tetramitiformis]|uniref:Uncharacterized protein n=1 Tax=Cymbomonas tetramitiformis TaxID=36881 RepID=A0AAE0F3K2_9CHLO|nr:hypothetical protein CYMTET_41478 [Cymbomonas tetramitiformis]
MGEVEDLRKPGHQGRDTPKYIEAVPESPRSPRASKSTRFAGGDGEVIFMSRHEKELAEQQKNDVIVERDVPYDTIVEPEYEDEQEADGRVNTPQSEMLEDLGPLSSDFSVHLSPIPSPSPGQASQQAWPSSEGNGTTRTTLPPLKKV